MRMEMRLRVAFVQRKRDGPSSSEEDDESDLEFVIAEAKADALKKGKRAAAGRGKKETRTA